MTVIPYISKSMKYRKEDAIRHYVFKNPLRAVPRRDASRSGRGVALARDGQLLAQSRLLQGSKTATQSKFFQSAGGP